MKNYILVCGSRDYDDEETMFKLLDRKLVHYENFIIIHGGATGADSLATKYCKINKIWTESFPVTSEQWSRLGKAAGPLRNSEMLSRNPVAVFAFSSQETFTPGTYDTVVKAMKMGIRIYSNIKVYNKIRSVVVKELVTKVKNSRVKYIRSKNLKEELENPYNVYIGRKGIVFIDGERFPKKDSPFCNIYKVDENNDLEKVLIMYEKYIRNRLKNEPELVEQLKNLKGKNLYCWCAPEKCHGDILVKLIDEYS